VTEDVNLQQFTTNHIVFWVAVNGIFTSMCETRRHVSVWLW